MSDLRSVLRELGKREMLNVMLEAGAEFNGAALKSRYRGQDRSLLCSEIHGDGRRADGGNFVELVCEIARA